MNNSICFSNHDGSYVLFTNVRFSNSIVCFDVFVKKTYFFIHTSKQCNVNQFNHLRNLIVDDNIETMTSEWSIDDNTLKITFTVSELHEKYLRLFISDMNNEAIIHIKIEKSELTDIAIHTQNYLNIFNIESFCYESSVSKDRNDITLAFIPFRRTKDKTSEMVSDGIMLSIFNYFFHIRQEIWIISEELDGIVKSLVNLFSKGVPCEIKLPDSFDYFLLKKESEGFYFVEGEVSDLEWQQNEIKFKGWCNQKTIQNLICSVQSRNELPVEHAEYSI